MLDVLVSLRPIWGKCLLVGAGGIKMISWEFISNITGDPRYRFCEAKCDLFQGHLGHLIIIAFPDPMDVGVLQQLLHWFWKVWD